MFTTKMQKKKIIAACKELRMCIIKNAHINLFGKEQSIEEEKSVYMSMFMIGEKIHQLSNMSKEKIFTFIHKELMMEELQILLELERMNLKGRIELRLYYCYRNNLSK